MNPDFLEARLIKFTFYIPPKTLPDQDSVISRVQEIPKGFDIYQVKGIVGRLFGLRPLTLRLIWETGEWDPVAGYEDEEEDSDEDDEVEFEESQENARGHSDDYTPSLEADNRELPMGKEKGKWMRREVELENGTRQIGFWLDGMDAKVRIELLDSMTN